MDNVVVGFQPGHDCSYCILVDGVPTIHEELERFLRKKEPKGDGLRMFFDAMESNNFPVENVKYFTHGNPHGRESDISDAKAFDEMHDLIDKNNGEYYVIGHHQSHAAAAFYSSNFKNALVITLDGAGYDGTTSDYTESTKNISTAFTVWEGNDIKLERKCIEISDNFSIGWPWHLATKRIFGLNIGYPHGHQAGTVMAMGTIGDPDKYYDVFIDNIKRGVDVDWNHFHELAKDEQEAFDIAAGLQKATEVKFREHITPYIEEYDGDSLCFSGGASLNSVMIGKILDWFPKIKNIHCDPVPYDGGLSLGSARYVWHHILENPRVKWKDNSSPYLGRTYGEEEINTAIEKYLGK